MVTWDAETYGTGVASVDTQHQQLFDMINVLLDERRRDTAEVRKLLVFLGEYVIKHFQEEEIVMAARACPVAALNKQEHARFIATFQRFMADFERDGITQELTQRIRKEMLDWLVNHITKVDRQLLANHEPSRRAVATPVSEPKKSGGLFGWFKGLFADAAALDSAVSSMESKELEGLNFATAVEAHNKWRVRLAAVIDGTSTEKLEPGVVSQDNQCVLGKWVHGGGAQKFGHEATFHQLRDTHAEFHAQAGRVLALAQGGQVADARKQLESGDYLVLSHRIRAQLASLYVSLSTGKLKAR